jgi:formylglycine-generating enzyme required for sulfatase activity
MGNLVPYNTPSNGQRTPPLNSKALLTGNHKIDWQPDDLLRAFDALASHMKQQGDLAGLKRLYEHISALYQDVTQAESSPDDIFNSSRPDTDNGATQQVRDHNEVHGTPAPGSVVGDGTVNGTNFAGRNIVNVGKDGIHIDQADVYVGENSPTTFKQAAMFDGLERTYLQRLIKVANRVPLGQLGIHSAKPDETVGEIHLESIYVPIDIARTESTARRADDPAALAQTPALSAVIRTPRLILLGDPGSGKSTFLNFLTLSLAYARLSPERDYLDRLSVPARKKEQRGASWTYGPLLPIHLEIKELAHDIPSNTRKGTADLVWKHIANQLAAANLGDFGGKLRGLLEKGECLVMFDGLDEIPNLDHRHLVAEAICDFADTYTKNRFLATCRVLSYTNPGWQLRSFPAQRLAPLSEATINTFIGNWYTALAAQGEGSQAWASQKTAELRRAACSLPDLAQNPMLLTVMAVIHTYKGTLPKERARLYQECVELLLWNWRRSKQAKNGSWQPGILEELDTREERLVNGLCEVAFHAQRSQGAWAGTAYIPEAEVMNILQRYLGNDWNKAQRFCKYVEEEAGLLVGRGEAKSGERMYSFPHRGFQEFLAGQHIVSGWEFPTLAASLAAEGDLWHEVLLLAIGHLVYNRRDVASPLIAIDVLTRIESPSTDTDWRTIWWAGEMLHIVGRSVAETDQHLGEKLVPKIVNLLVKLVEGGHLTPAERAQAADVLGLLGDRRPGVADLPRLVPFEGGPFEMGAGDDAHPVNLGPFSLACYPITNAQFRAFVEDGGYTTKKYWTAAGWEWRSQNHQIQGLLDDPYYGIDNRPVVGITWYEAVAYARWLAATSGKPFRLPTEAEWERAAAGTEGRRYPFGSRAHDQVANARDAGIGQTTAVGVFPGDQTPEGLFDMAGNVWEWCSSLDRPYPYRVDDGRENLEGSDSRILRGGSFDSPRKAMHSTERRSVNPHAVVSLIGFRVAADAR